MTSIWVPPTHYDKMAAEIREAVKRYDRNLNFGLNEKTQQWCVFLEQGTMEASKNFALPILGFSKMPSIDEVIERLHNSDAFRRGMEIVNELQRHNDKLLDDSKYKDVDGDVAEHLEWGMRKMSHPNAPIRVHFGG